MAVTDTAPTPRWAAILPMAILCLAAFTSGATGHSDTAKTDDHGTLTWHDRPEGAATRVLTCEGWVQGTGVSHASGTIEAIHRHGDGLHSHTVDTWTGEADGPGSYRFTAGPFVLHATGTAWLSAEMGEEAEHSTSQDTVQYTSCEDEPQPPGIPDPPTCSSARTSSHDVIEIPRILC